MTTPQLHHIVRCINTRGAYGEPTEEGYYKKLADAYKILMEGKHQAGPVTVDCANGVGAPKMKALAECIGKEHFDYKLINEDIDVPAKLNHNVGHFIALSSSFHTPYKGLILWCSAVQITSKLSNVFLRGFKLNHQPAMLLSMEMLTA